MSESIYNLIKENRRLFYTGLIRNQYKTEISFDENKTDEQAIYTISQKQSKNPSFASRSIDLLQELFAE